MEEKGDNALDMGDDEPEDENGEQSAQAQEASRTGQKIYRRWQRNR